MFSDKKESIYMNPCTPFLDRVLDPPTYPYQKQSELYVPTKKEVFKEFLGRINIFKTKKNWLPFFGWTATLSLAIPLVIFFTHYFTWPLFAVAFVYSMVVMGTHATIWLHRYSTHRAYQFKSSWYRFIVRNLSIKIIPEEIYVVSHHVHHAKSDQPGDPYNPKGGWLYCFLADANHQCVNQTLPESDYLRMCKMLEHTGVKTNSYAQYQKWGSICHPLRTVLHYALNWGAWAAICYLIGGPALVATIFGAAGVWGIGVRTFNYDGHGGGRDQRKPGNDFNRNDLSINQLWPGYVSGEWHNNHHLYPHSARAGFLSYQIDLAWIFIKTSNSLGLLKNVKDSREDFMERYYRPFFEQGGLGLAPLLSGESQRERIASHGTSK